MYRCALQSGTASPVAVLARSANLIKGVHCQKGTLLRKAYLALKRGKLSEERIYIII